MSSESILSRSAAIRHHVSGDPLTVRKYAATAARWEATRLLIVSGQSVPADDARFADLSTILRTLTDALGLKTCTDVDRGAEGIPGLTDPNGFLPRDPSRIVDCSWRDAAEGW